MWKPLPLVAIGLAGLGASATTFALALTSGHEAQPQQYERRVLAFFDRALLAQRAR